MSPVYADRLMPAVQEDEAGTILSDLVPRMLETNRIPNSKLVSLWLVTFTVH